MDCRRRLLLLLPALLAVLPASGCSSVGGLFGLTPPAHKLIPAAEQLRSAAGAPAPLPRELNKALLPAYVVEPGDTLLVIPARLDSPIRLPGDQTVMQDGTIDLGEFGRPVVAGKTLPAIQSEITSLIAAKEKAAAAPVIDVRLVGRVSKVYYVLGEVNAPGAFPIQGRETTLDGIIAAGGITRRASTKKIILSRPTQPDGCRVVLPICYDNIVQLGDTSTNYQLMPGDRIYVASKGMLDDLCPGRSNKGCSACNGPQIPCPLGGGVCGESVPGVAPVMPAPAFPQTGTLPPAH
jgi:protein involved in polysaccharide export with SLBB domain